MCVCVHVHACVYKETHENKRLSAQQRTNMARVLKAHYLPHLGQKAPKDLIFLTIIIGGNFFFNFFLNFVLLSPSDAPIERMVRL